MGDRANICMEYGHAAGVEPKRIFFYGHYAGQGMPWTLQRGLIRGKPRWNDESYLARIIFCTLVEGSEDKEMGFGIAPYICDNEHPLLLVDPAKKEVRVLRVNDGTSITGWLVDYANPIAKFTFEQYVNLESADWSTLLGANNED